MIRPTCKHKRRTGKGKDRKGYQRWKCLDCGVSWTERPRKLLGDMRINVETAKLALRLLLEGSSVRSVERITKLHRDTVCRLIVFFGERCRKFMDARMQNLQLTHLQFDEQWTFVGKKQSRLTIGEKATCHDIGDVYLWTCIDQQTKLMPSFVIGKRSADNARRFLCDVANRLRLPGPGQADDHAFVAGRFRPVVQISTDGWAGYPEAVDLAFGPHARYGSLIKEYRNATMTYTPSEMVGTKRTGHRGIEGNELFTICTSHVERLNGTQRLFMKRLNRLTYCFSKKLENLEAAFAMFAAHYNFCWRTRKPGKSGQKRPTAAMMAKLTDHLWSFDELFMEVLNVD